MQARDVMITETKVGRWRSLKVRDISQVKLTWVGDQNEGEKWIHDGKNDVIVLACEITWKRILFSWTDSRLLYVSKIISFQLNMLSLTETDLRHSRKYPSRVAKYEVLVNREVIQNYISDSLAELRNVCGYVRFPRERL